MFDYIKVMKYKYMFSVVGYYDIKAGFYGTEYRDKPISRIEEESWGELEHGSYIQEKINTYDYGNSVKDARQSVFDLLDSNEWDVIVRVAPVDGLKPSEVVAKIRQAQRKNKAFKYLFIPDAQAEGMGLYGVVCGVVPELLGCAVSSVEPFSYEMCHIIANKVYRAEDTRKKRGKMYFASQGLATPRTYYYKPDKEMQFDVNRGNFSACTFTSLEDMVQWAKKGERMMQIYRNDIKHTGIPKDIYCVFGKEDIIYQGQPAVLHYVDNKNTGYRYTSEVKVNGNTMERSADVLPCLYLITENATGEVWYCGATYEPLQRIFTHFGLVGYPKINSHVLENLKGRKPKDFTIEVIPLDFYLDTEGNEISYCPPEQMTSDGYNRAESEIDMAEAYMQMNVVQAGMAYRVFVKWDWSDDKYFTLFLTDKDKISLPPNIPKEEAAGTLLTMQKMNEKYLEKYKDVNPVYQCMKTRCKKNRGWNMADLYYYLKTRELDFINTEIEKGNLTKGAATVCRKKWDAKRDKMIREGFLTNDLELPDPFMCGVEWL